MPLGGKIYYHQDMVPVSDFRPGEPLHDSGRRKKKEGTPDGRVNGQWGRMEGENERPDRNRNQKSQIEVRGRGM